MKSSDLKQTHKNLVAGRTFTEIEPLSSSGGGHERHELDVLMCQRGARNYLMEVEDGLEQVEQLQRAQSHLLQTAALLAVQSAVAQKHFEETCICCKVVPL